jgi:hypothetical protein
MQFQSLSAKFRGRAVLDPVKFLSGSGSSTFTLTAILVLQWNQNMFLMKDGYRDGRAEWTAYVHHIRFCTARVTRLANRAANT